MFRWCAYCQKLMGEVEPYHDFRLSHGMCKECAKSHVYRDNEAIDRLKPLVDFYRRLQVEAGLGATASIQALVRDGKGLGINASDLLVGMVQPALHHIGELWERGEISVVQEHTFTRYCSLLINDIELQYAPSVLFPSDLTLLLVSAPNNYHILGIRVVELFMRVRGVTSTAVFPGLPAKEIRTLVGITRPKFLGISVSTRTQRRSLVKIAERMRGMPTVLLAGGSEIKRAGRMARDPKEFIYVREVGELPEVMDLKKAV